ncbi:MAG: tRNA (N6-threonylcarbamoyladenosine(37)-N6)-methyltransferase TrmO [Nitrososphaerales archaeon]
MQHPKEENEIKFKPIGIVHTNASDDEVRRKVPGQESTIEIYPEFEEALDGLAEFSHIFVLGYFNRLRPEQIGPLKVRPRGLLKRGLKLEELPLIGVLALDSPTRPNPIGLSLVPVVKLEKTQIVVTGLDLFDGTPVLDIKPYQASYRAEGFKLSSWHAKLAEKAGHV